MNIWEGIQNAIRYIEDNLTEELDIADIAAKANISAFHFQRIFSVLCGFTVGEYIRSRRFSMEGSYSEIPKFWQEHMSDSGIVIGDPRQEVPEGYETRQIPAPKALQDVNTRIWNERLPNCTEYRPGGNYDIEMYTAPTEDPAKTYSEIWIPVVKA
ncbi:MAG: AraC family transcriptional regulator [Oscillospiraceae bacterium]